MDWIKVTPETMQPEMEPVMVTVFHEWIVEEDVFSAVFNMENLSEKSLLRQ